MRSYQMFIANIKARKLAVVKCSLHNYTNRCSK